jgi:hypothetical protein
LFANFVHGIFNIFILFAGVCFLVIIHPYVGEKYSEFQRFRS